MNTAKLHIGGITGVVLAFFMCLAPGYAQEAPPKAGYFDGFTNQELDAAADKLLAERRAAQAQQNPPSRGTVVEALQRGTGMVVIIGGIILVSALASAAFRAIRRKKDSPPQP